MFLPERNAVRTVPVYDGDRLMYGNRLKGPAVIESINTSIFVPTGYSVEYDALGNCVMTRGRSAGARR